MKPYLSFLHSGLVACVVLGWSWLEVQPACAAPAKKKAPRPSYVVVDLGTLRGGSESSARAINDLGYVAGSATTAQGTTRPFLYRRGRMIEIPVPPEFADGGAFAINNSGLVLGCYENSPGLVDEIGFVYRDGVTTTLAEYTRNQQFVGAALNDAGDIAGWFSYPLANRNEAVVFRNGGGFRPVPVPFRTRSSAARAINSLAVAGEAVMQNGSNQIGFLSAFDYGPPLSPQHTVVNDISGLDEVVGLSYFPTGPRAFRYSDGVMHDLGTLDGLDYSEARGINSYGVIVGYASGGGSSRAFVYRDGGMLDLNALIPRNSGWKLEVAHDLNNRGQIVGEGRHRGRVRAFLLTPVQRP